MQNAHERFGTLEFTKRMKDTTTRVRVYIDRVVLEPAQNEQGQVTPLPIRSTKRLSLTFPEKDSTYRTLSCLR
jgi:hypothetical protein